MSRLRLESKGYGATAVAAHCLSVSAALVLLGCTAHSDRQHELGPSLGPLVPGTVVVNETLIVSILADNPTGVSLAFSWSGPPLPGLDRSVDLASSLAGAVFSYTPLASHVGEHEFIVEATWAGGKATQGLRITVVPAASAAPVFLRPGAGGTFDLAKNPCVRVDVEVRDDDSAEVTLSVAQGLPDGATFLIGGPKVAEFVWCPAAAQVDASERWPLVFEANDGTHAPTLHGYLVILRRPSKQGCPGEPPEIAIHAPKPGETAISSGGVQIEFTVNDDFGLRDPPIVFWTTHEIEDVAAPALDTFNVAVAKPLNGGFVATIAPLDLAPGEERIVSVVVSATDNDDPTGTACDHTTDSPLLQFVASGAAGGEKLGACSPCVFSSDCASGLCVATQQGGRCMPKCGGACSGATCQPATSVEGAIQSACGDVLAYCELSGLLDGRGGVECSPDAHEPNDSVAEAKPIGAGPTAGAICSGDVDFFAMSVAANHRLTLTLAPADLSTGDLDLHLRSSAGDLVMVSASAGANEQVSTCPHKSSTWIAEVVGYAGQTGPYSLDLAVKSEDCCVDDSSEPDNSPAQARPLPLPGLGEGVICPFNDDYFLVDVLAPSQISLTAVTASDGLDIDIQVYGPSGAIVAAGETVGDESFSWAAANGPHYVRAFGRQGSTGEYLLEVVSGVLAACTSDLACPTGTVCSLGQCKDALCSGNSQCPPTYVCPVAGPVSFPSLCGAPCTQNTQCRPDEACKYFYEGRFCGLKGTGANGAPCAAFFDCGGQRSCLPWPKGYCARDGCKNSADCEAGTHCVPVSGVASGAGTCVVDCWPSDSICRLSDGYECGLRKDVNGAFQFVCVP